MAITREFANRSGQIVTVVTYIGICNLSICNLFIDRIGWRQCLLNLNAWLGHYFYTVYICHTAQKVAGSCHMARNSRGNARNNGLALQVCFLT